MFSPCCVCWRRLQPGLPLLGRLCTCQPGSAPASWPVLGWCSLLAALLARSAWAGLPACRCTALLCTQLPPHRHLSPLRPHLPNLCSLRPRSFQPTCCNGRPAGLPPAAVGGCLHEGKCRHTRPARQQAERGARPLQQAQQRHAPGALAEAAWEHGVKHAARQPALEARIKTADVWDPRCRLCRSRRLRITADRKYMVCALPVSYLGQHRHTAPVVFSQSP